MKPEKCVSDGGTCGLGGYCDQCPLLRESTSDELAQGLREFADSMLQVAWEGGCADGADIQEDAIKAGLLREVTRTEPCGEYCPCSEFTDFPTKCYETVY